MTRVKTETISVKWGRPGRNRMLPALPIFFLTLAIAATFSPLFLGQFYATGDVRDVYIPLELFFQQEQRAGRLPSWHPDIAWGYPVIASGQIGFFYPPLFLARTLLSIQIYLPAVFLGHGLALAVGTFILLRELHMSKAGSYLGSISFALSSFILQHATHLNIFFALSWLPWQLTAAVRSAKKAQLEHSDIIRLIMLLGIPYLVGQLQIPLLMSIVTSTLFVYTRWHTRHTVVRSLGIVAVVAVGVFCLAAAQLVPTIELAQHSSRAKGGDFDIKRANQMSLPLYHVPTLLFPRFYGHDETYWGKRLEIEYGIFIGALPALLALWAAFGHRMTVIKHETLRFFKWLLIITFLLALGNLSPFRLVGLEPSLWYFSAPARWLVFTSLSLAIFAAAGFDRLQQERHAFEKFASIGAIVVTITVVVLNVVLFAGRNNLSHTLISIINATVPQTITTKPQSYYLDKLSVLIASAQHTSVSLTSAFTTFPLIILAMTVFALGRRHARTLFLAATAVELTIIGIATLTPTILWKHALEPPRTVTYLPASVQQKESRIFSTRPSGDTGAYFTDPQSRANAQIREQQRNLLAPLLSAQFGVPGVEWPASLDILGHEITLEQLRGDGSYIIQDLKLASELNIGALLASKDTEVPSEIQFYTELPDINIYTLNPAPRASLVDKQGNQVAGSARYQSITLTKTRITTDTPQDATLLIRDTKYPGWNAFVDGIRVPIESGMSIFRAINVPAGHHVVEMEYVPKALYGGVMISVVTFTLCLAGSFTRREIRV